MTRPMRADSDQPPADAPSRTLHDAFFKQVFGDPALAAAELQAVIPALADHVDWPSLTPAPSNVVNAVFQQRVGDLVFHARLAAGGEALLWFLIEHQSSSCPWGAAPASDET
jgi:hypothetical protein